jgi:hypothetical protein
MEITYQITQGDFVDALRSHRDRTPFRKWGLRLALSIVFGFAGIGLILVVAEPGTQTLSTFAPLFGISVLWAFLWWGGPRWSARTQYRKQPSVQGPRNTTLNEKGVTWKWDGGSADVEWKNFHRWQESKTQFILYASPMMFNMLPKRRSRQSKFPRCAFC